MYSPLVNMPDVNVIEVGTGGPRVNVGTTVSVRRDRVIGQSPGQGAGS